MSDPTCACGNPLPSRKRRTCDDCKLKSKRAAALRAYYQSRRRAGRPCAGDELTGTCIYCNAQFEYVMKNRERSVCPTCEAKRSGQARALWAQRNPESVAAIRQRYRKNNPLKGLEGQERKRYRLYKVTPEWEAETLAAQGGTCGNPGCGATEPGGRWKTWNIDHDHRTGAPRGLLCSRCNKGIGLFGDDVEKLAGAITYLQRFAQASTA